VIVIDPEHYIDRMGTNHGLIAINVVADSNDEAADIAYATHLENIEDWKETDFNIVREPIRKVEEPAPKKGKHRKYIDVSEPK
jgi:hypothetical protein